MTISVHQPQYLPWLGYFEKIAKSDCFVFLDCVQYKHREFQNRNRIRTADGELWLTVPVITKGSHDQRIDQVLIDQTSKWQGKHWHSITAAYNKAPYFKDHAGFFEDVYIKKEWTHLHALNVYVVEYLLQALNITTPIRFESELKTTQVSTERIIEICRKCDADTYLSGAGGKEYMDENRFAQEHIQLQYQQYQHPVYCQQYMKDDAGFMPYMSVIDLLFNEGQNSKNVLLRI